MSNLRDGMLVMAAGLLLISQGCEFKEPVSLNPGQGDAGVLAKVAAFQITMDEESYTFALHPPLGVEQQDENELFLEYYQKTRETFSFDKNGYLSNTVKNIEGNADIRMPLYIWDDTKDIRPAVSSNSNPITLITMSDGTLEYSGPKGAISTESYDPEEIRIDPSYIDSMFITKDDTTEARAKERLQQLENEGAIFTMLDSFYVKIDNFPQEGYLSKISRVMNLKTGLTIKTAYYLKDGNFNSYEYSYFMYVSNFPVEAETVTFNFGDYEGNWQAKTVTYPNRTNISVTRIAG